METNNNRNMWDVNQLNEDELKEAYITALRFVKNGLMKDSRSADQMLNSDNFLTRVQGFHKAAYLKYKQNNKS